MTPAGRAASRLLAVLEACAHGRALPAVVELVAAALAAADAAVGDASSEERRSVALLLGALAEQAARAERLNDPSVLLSQAIVVAAEPALATVLAWRVAGTTPSGALAALHCIDRLETAGAVAVARSALASGAGVQPQAAVTLLELAARQDDAALVDCCALFAAMDGHAGGAAAGAHLLIAAQLSRRDEFAQRIAEVLAAPPPGRGASLALAEHAVRLRSRHPEVDEVLAHLAERAATAPRWVAHARG